MPTYKSHLGKKLCCEARWAVGIDRGLVGQSELGATASRKAIWWYLRLTSLLAHLFAVFGSGLPSQQLLSFCYVCCWCQRADV